MLYVYYCTVYMYSTSTTVPLFCSKTAAPFLACISIPLFLLHSTTASNSLTVQVSPEAPRTNQLIKYPISDNYRNLLLSPGSPLVSLVSSSPATNPPALEQSESLPHLDTYCMSFPPPSSSPAGKPIPSNKTQLDGKTCNTLAERLQLNPWLYRSSHPSSPPTSPAFHLRAVRRVRQVAKSTPNTNTGICPCRDRMDGAPLS